MPHKTAYPLSEAQKVILEQQKYSLNKAISNINIMVHFEAEVDDELMLQALSMGLARNRSASFQIRKTDKKNYEQYFASTTPEPIEIVDFSHASDEELNSYLKKEGSIAFPNKCFDVPLYKIKYILKPSGMRGVYIVANHMVLDAYSMIFMAEDVFNIYEALCEDRALPKPFRSALSLLDKERDYLESTVYQRDLAFWKEVFKDEPQYSSLHPAGSKNYTRNKRTGKVVNIGFKSKSSSWLGKIPAELVEKTRNFAGEHGVTIQSLYILPIRNIHSKACDFSEDTMFSNTLSHRSTLLEKVAGGTRASMIPLRLKLRNELSFLDAAKEMTRLYTSYYKHSECPYLSILNVIRDRFHNPIGQGYSSTFVSFQLYTLKKRKNLPLRLEHISSGQLFIGLYITFINLDNSGDMYGVYEYNLNMYKTSDLIEKLHNSLVESLTYALDQPDVTLKRLMEKF